MGLADVNVHVPENHVWTLLLHKKCLKNASKNAVYYSAGNHNGAVHPFSRGPVLEGV